MNTGHVLSQACRYEFYYDVVCVGRYIFKIRDLHAQYGPIIRINPDEVHVIDPEFYDELYIGPSSTRKRNKWFWMYDSFGIPASVFSTTDHEVHRMRRNALGVFFSKAKVRKLQDRVVDIGTRFLDRLAEFQTKGEPMPLGLAWTAVTSGQSCRTCNLASDTNWPARYCRILFVRQTAVQTY